MAYQLTAIAILDAMPGSVTDWSDEQKPENGMSIWWNHVTHPKTDTDDFYINAILHPYWGASYCVKAPERACLVRTGFWHAFLCSSIYVSCAEAPFENPSIQDIVVTRIGGTLVGAFS